MLFNFPNINLPDSVSNEPGSHGYIQYKVKLKDNLPLLTTIENTAYIYFDFNPPVVTNTTTNQITTVSSNELTNNVAFTLYPNPVHSGSILHFNYSGKGKSILHVFDLTGRIVFTEMLNASSTQIRLPEVAAGVYECVVSTPVGSAHRKLVVK